MTNDEIITHLDEILADLADERAEYRQTTVGYINKKWKVPPAGTHWSNGDLSHDAATIKLEELKTALKPAPPPPPPPPPPSVVGRLHNRVAHYNIPAHPERYGLVATAGVSDANPGIKAAGASPGIYKDAVRIGPPSDLPSGANPDVNYAVSNTEGSAWKLGPGWYGGSLADIGNPAYQAKWTANAIAAAKAKGFEWIFVDNCLWKTVPLPSTYDPGWDPNKGSTKWQAGMLAFITYLSTEAHKNGLKVIGNVGSACDTQNLARLRQWWTPMDGWMDEGLGHADSSNHSGTHDTGERVKNWLQMIGESEAAGKQFMGAIPADDGDLALMEYGYGILLIASRCDGSSSAGVAGTNTYDKEIWTPVQDRVNALGKPLAAASGSMTTGFIRPFENGHSVRLNPTTAGLSIGGLMVPAATAVIQ